MKDFTNLIRRFLSPYKHLVAWNIFFNVITAFMSIFSFFLIVPILRILFKVDDTVYSYIDMNSSNIFNREHGTILHRDSTTHSWILVSVHDPTQSARHVSEWIHDFSRQDLRRARHSETDK